MEGRGREGKEFRNAQIQSWQAYLCPREGVCGGAKTAYYAPPLIGGALSDALSDVCLTSV